MKKINKILGLFIGSLFVLGFVGIAKAVSPTISITKLPEYIRIQDFNISYSALTDDVINGNPDLLKVQFYVKKEGGSYSAFESILTGASNQVSVSSSQVGESEKKYCFKAEILSGIFSNETCTVFDQNSPDAPHSYSKERIAPNTYTVKWTTPNNDDFSRVFVYRSEVLEFTADGNTKVGEVGGAKDTVVEWDNNSLDPSKEYYYALRAIDKAGNASDLVGDQGVVAGTVQGVSTTTEEEKVVIIPVEKTIEEEPEGQVLPAETEAPETLGDKAGNVVQDFAQFAKDRTKITVGIGLGIIVVVGLIIYFFKKHK